MTHSTPTIVDLHPVEALILLVWLVVEAVGRVLAAAPPRPVPAPVVITQPLAAAAPAVGIGPSLTVAQLRTMARQRGLRTAGGRPIHKARRADLLSALEL